jgi:hypothetical protein
MGIKYMKYEYPFYGLKNNKSVTISLFSKPFSTLIIAHLDFDAEITYFLFFFI